MKKVISLALAAVICSASMLLAACGGSTTKTIATVDDLEGAKIGVQLGTTGDIYASDYEEKGSTVERFNKGADAVLALTQGKIDCVIIDSEPSKAFDEANDGLKILDEPFAEEEYAICVAKDNTDLLGKINTALAELKADGTTESIEKNFIGDDTKGKTPYVTPAASDYQNRELHMATNAAFPPYEMTEDSGGFEGIDVEIAEKIAAKLGLELVVDDMDFSSVLTSVQGGKADIAMAGLTVTPDRQKNVDFTD